MLDAVAEHVGGDDASGVQEVVVQAEPDLDFVLGVMVDLVDASAVSRDWSSCYLGHHTVSEDVDEAV